MKQTIEERIKQRRLQILVHSYIYYELNDSIVSDNQWARWAQDLVGLQHKYPIESQSVIYAEQFKNFDGSTGAFFLYDSKIIETANMLLRNSEAPVPKQVQSKPVKKQKKRLF